MIFRESFLYQSQLHRHLLVHWLKYLNLVQFTKTTKITFVSTSFELYVPQMQRTQIAVLSLCRNGKSRTMNNLIGACFMISFQKQIKNGIFDSVSRILEHTRAKISCMESMLFVDKGQNWYVYLI